MPGACGMRHGAGSARDGVYLWTSRQTPAMLDIIGDIHGHADKLEALLQKMGYRKGSSGHYAHPQRQALFLGDYIDRGPDIPKVLNIVRSMTEGGSATALMGNHEYNALCFNFRNPDGGYLRDHSIKNIRQHFQTLDQFHNRQAEYDDHLEWFLQLPLWFENDDLRAVHACWDARIMAVLANSLPSGRLDGDLLRRSCLPDNELAHAVDISLKGWEVTLPDDLRFTDPEGYQRRKIRIKWWEDPATTSLHQLSVEDIAGLSQQPLDPALYNGAHWYRPEEKAVFFGHYWLKNIPTLQRHNVCCLDFSVARNGHLAAYRFGEGGPLKPSWLVYV